MKKNCIWMAAGLMLALAACQEKGGYTIKGTIEGAATGDTVYLQRMENKVMQKVDSAIVKDGKFRFTGTPDSSIVESQYITYAKGPVHGAATVFIEEGTIQVKMEAHDCHVSGTVNNDIFQQFSDVYQKTRMEMESLYAQTMRDTTMTPEQRDSIGKIMEQTEKAGLDNIYAIISENADKPAGVYLLTRFGSAFDAEQIEPLLAKVPAAYASQEEMVELKEYVDNVLKTAEGKPYVDFTMNDPQGKPVKLSDFVTKNTYTLIDFWASWCAPCRQEMPTVVEAYNTYKSKGFGVVGVSLDQDADKWKNAIKDLKITWPQMSDLKGWRCEGAALYAVRAIPATVLVDQEGTIVARNLRGQELLDKLQELMK